MIKEDAKKLSEILSSDTFKFGGLKSDLVIKIVRIQIIIDPIAKAVKEAAETAVKSLTTPRFKELNEKAQAGKLQLGTPEATEFIELRSSFDEKFEKAMAPINSAKVEAEVPTLTEEEFKDLCTANSFTGAIPATIYRLLVAISK
ncbi:MAG: hypothetical protein ACI4C3_02925 [Bacteroides sp.]